MSSSVGYLQKGQSHFEAGQDLDSFLGELERKPEKVSGARVRALQIRLLKGPNSWWSSKYAPEDATLAQVETRPEQESAGCGQTSILSRRWKGEA